jgi:hypothetical protein
MIVNTAEKRLGSCNCGSERAEVQEGELNVILFCAACKEYRGSHSRIDIALSCCRSPRIRYTEREIRGGSKQILRQCQNCGHSILNLPIARSKVPTGEEILAFDSELNSDYDTRLSDENRKGWALFQESHIERRKKEFDEWLTQRYYPYLQSSKWKRKEEYVLKRDNFLCQACLESEATTAHHTSRNFFQNEPLFDLVAICESCKDKIITIEREIYSDPEKRRWVR